MTIARLTASVLLFATALCASPDGALAQTGRFVGELAYRPIGGGNHEVTEYFEFRAADGQVWGVPKGAITDGASIPRSLWTVWGHPFGGKYVRAAVVHDYYCEIKTRPWEDVHKVFYEAMLADNEAQSRAKWMYLAVYYAGPRWTKTEALTNKRLCQQLKASDGSTKVVCSVVRVKAPVTTLAPPIRPRSSDELAKAPTAARIEDILASIDKAGELEAMPLDQIEGLVRLAREELVATRN